MKAHVWKIIAMIGALILIVNIIYFGVEMHNINNQNTWFLREMQLQFEDMPEETYQAALPTYMSLAKHSAVSGFAYRMIFVVGVTVLGVGLTKYRERNLDKPVTLILLKVLFFFMYLIGFAFVGNRVLMLSGFAVLVASVFVFVCSLVLAQVTVNYIARPMD
ncbi:MAG: hypothetical protein FH749_14020 [Firmicutes bacterium]|nr:hypothetical protein [Bacillota bacterium]